MRMSSIFPGVAKFTGEPRRGAILLVRAKPQLVSSIQPIDTLTSFPSGTPHIMELAQTCLRYAIILEVNPPTPKSFDPILRTHSSILVIAYVVDYFPSSTREWKCSRESAT